MKKKFLLLFSIACCSAIQAQNNTVSNGGDAEGSNGSISYSIGQVVYTSATGSNGSINQGVQQPYNFDVITGIEHTEIELSIYPNPTIGQVNLSIADSRTQEYSLQLFDATGRLLIADRGNNAIRIISILGVVSTLAGNRTGGLQDGTGAGAVFNSPASIACVRCAAAQVETKTMPEAPASSFST